ncbi:MAG: response regulator [Maribacter dokdonensis]|uniref:Response regulator receiver domain-containing protein n=1 Tax=Maribacter dokdonensis TaxID=320912 RepID=A0A1H4N2Y5_9FLAO|nr:MULTISPECIES: response regulator [Maribacter]HAF76685.1 response regulator [Maribacter sp.]KSA14992.1 Two-component response regulator [Maribacter dokdonensis DSW-8]MBU2900109.1 response regulator [Maribacter dokdonensis]PHN94356.1 response regulator [Maribacter sp. 6B07]CAG2534903.1 Response regulator receiver domain-containing protein [Maribacter dokdonensis]|tara:strand:+ start:496 stop:894 length:399 start_codon:yes stop_codon:yes gene_type:complete
MKNNINVCIIDDDDVFQYTILHTLQVHKSVNHIIPFTDGAEAMTFLKANINNDQELPDVIFLDINMPVMDGYGFMQQYESLIPNLAKKITVYILSSSVDLVDFDKTKKINQVTDYIVKPIRDNQLTRILAEL